MTAAAGEVPPVRPVSESAILAIAAGYGAAFVLFGVALDGPVDVLRGIGRIVTTRDALLTDYFADGIGAACANAGLLTICAAFLYHRARAKISGPAVACLFLVLGFGLFGKNLLNVWSIVLGVYLYARFKGEAFGTHINTAFFGAALAPIFSEILFSSTLPLGARLPLAVVTGLATGFALAPAAAQLFKAHMGFSLYNMGFTAGIVATLIVALYKSYGFVPDPVMIWTTGNNALLTGFLSALFGSMIGIGYGLDPALMPRLRRILAQPGQAPSDYVDLVGFGPTLVNMGLTGFVGTAYVLAIGGDLNGPVIGAILSIVGFAAYGKHPRNILPIMAGVLLGSLAKPWNPTDPGAVLAALFGTTLAPIAGTFGWRWGVVAGFVHSSTAMSVGVVHAGLNLYNNGFAAGLVASVLVPIILAVRRTRPEDAAAPTPPPGASGAGR